MTLPQTLGDLQRSGYTPRSVRDELRNSVIDRVRSKTPLVPGLVGYDATVLPELERALLVGHDLILLGQRGQGKTRIIRSLSTLLDEWMPAIAGSEINEDPFNPLLERTKRRIITDGDATPIVWIHRSERQNEKLATPDTTIADLIGEVDPIKVAEGRHLDDLETIHLGLIPRTNRGIFAINELPDLPERIQVGLLSVLEERDVQVRGYTIQLPLDIVFVASANPEDYTSRGRLITPLKDRFGSQIRTHYPASVSDEIAVMRQESLLPPLPVHLPELIEEIIATIALVARKHPSISQYSGVSVRASISGYEAAAASAILRAMRNVGDEAAVRLSDLGAVRAAFSGKIEVDAIDANEEDRVLTTIIDQSIARVFRDRFGTVDLDGVTSEIAKEPVNIDGEDPTARYQELLERAAFAELFEARDPVDLPAEIELVLEGLYLAKRIGKNILEGHASYRSKG
ncbi:MAG: sigma 54-interacting transcriptional regulator [Ferrimicrobium sp.]